MRRYIVCSAMALALCGGCASQRFAQEEKTAKNNIHRAREAGADDASVLEARTMLDLAKRYERQALDDREAAQDELQKARDDLSQATQNLEQRRSRVQAVKDQQEAAERAEQRARDHQGQLSEKGLSESEVQNATGADSAVTHQRVRTLKISVGTGEKLVQLAELDQKTARAAMDAAQAKLDSAEQRLTASHGLYDQATQQAKSAEAEALAAKHAAIGQQLQNSANGSR